MPFVVVVELRSGYGRRWIAILGRELGGLELTYSTLEEYGSLGGLGGIGEGGFGGRCDGKGSRMKCDQFVFV